MRKVSDIHKMNLIQILYFSLSEVVNCLQELIDNIAELGTVYGNTESVQNADMLGVSNTALQKENNASCAGNADTNTPAVSIAESL